MQVYVSWITQYFDQSEFNIDPVKDTIFIEYNTLNPNISYNRVYKVS
jgi:hypothetical protein